MLWIKALHIVFIASWFAGLFYLPRIFVNLAMVPTDSIAERERLLLMAGKLYRFMTPLGVLAVALGLWLWFGYGFSGGWLHAKTALVVLLGPYVGFFLAVVIVTVIAWLLMLSAPNTVTVSTTLSKIGRAHV